MKKIGLLTIIATILFASCEKEQEMYKLLPPGEATLPVLAAHAAISITLDNMNESTVFKWKKAFIGAPADIEYTLYAKIGDGDATSVAVAFGDSLTVTLENVNKAVINAGGQPGEAVEVTFYLIGRWSDNYQLTSNSITVSITTAEPLFPDVVYMIGKEFGDWGWGNAGVAEMIPVNGNPGKFWCVRHFANPENGFKWNTKKEWGGDFYSLGTDVGFTTGSGNAFVATAGFYIVVVDYTINTITIEPAQVYGMGECFGGWDTGKYPFTAEGNVMKITTTASNDLRMYANAAAAGVGGDWWRMEFIIYDGKIAYRGNGDDQMPRVKVDAGKTVTLDFNNGTGTIQ